MLGSTDIKISDNFFLSLNCSELARVSSLLVVVKVVVVISVAVLKKSED